MTVKRPKSKSISREGVNFVKTIIEGRNHIFQEIGQENDIGNDAYIEFVKEERATSFCIAVQIKAGKSYISDDGRTYYLDSDKDHFEYWIKHVLPIGGIVFNPETQTGVWCDITEYLQQNPRIIEKGPYRINISSTRIFSKETGTSLPST